MAGYIPKEQLDAYRRWQAESFDPPPPEPPPPPPPPIVVEDLDSELVTDFDLPTAEDIEHIHNEAHRSGYEAGHEAGYQTGFAEGREEGYRTGFESVEAQARQLASLADNLEASLGSIDQTVADQLLALALEVANQVVRSSIAGRPEILLPIIRESLAALPLHHGHVTLHIHPEEADLVREQLGEHFAQSGWRILEDREIQAGGCFIRAGSSEVDATLETRWQRVLEAIGADPSAWLQKA